MTNDDAGREPYIHYTPPQEWGCIIETPEGRHVRTDYDRWPWSGEGEADSKHADDYIARIGWRLARPEQDVFASIHAATIRAALAGVRCDDWPAEALAVADVVAERDRLLAGGCARDQRTTQWCAEAQAACVERDALRAKLDEVAAERDDLAERARVDASAKINIYRLVVGRAPRGSWSDAGVMSRVSKVVAERDALRRIVGEIDLALSGAPASGRWGPRALSVYDLMDAIDADDYSDAEDAVRCAQAMAAVVRDVARERIAAERDGGAS